MMQSYQTRRRKEPESNYDALFLDDGTTLRWRIDQSKPILPLRHPDTVDVSLGAYCTGGCRYCYASATAARRNFPNPLSIIDQWMASIPEQSRPFQVAIGGDGEPTESEHFVEVCHAFASYGVLPNFTTNGVKLTESLLSEIADVIGGVAISVHDHLQWENGIDAIMNFGFPMKRVNLHVVVGEPGTAEKARMLREVYANVAYVVLLPYIAHGRAKRIDVETEYHKAIQIAESGNGYALGALFTDFLRKHYPNSKYRLYDHEFFSGFMRLDKVYMMRSSYDTAPRHFDVFSEVA